ncbi:hypothetical protein [Acidithiobacillus ferrooxidans]|uniref:hypothetical protein n=1 Tax=Acidithiobacillus ferrooxidans TaxID=920 RepID=UPI002148D8BC|nr:hypothetical protein [Acidithiobacillus ferrooxidans]MCR1355219.1 hypothetical protein [Acidithiobacillus ferrooxidans]
MDQNQLFSPAIGLVPPWLVDHVSFTVERTASPEPHHERLVRAFHDGAGHEVAIVIPDTLLSTVKEVDGLGCVSGHPYGAI